MGPQSPKDSAAGLRVGIVPASQGRSDKIRIDNQKNLVICPLPYDGSFMELFYNGLLLRCYAARSSICAEFSKTCSKTAEHFCL